jgi:peroxiredoxin
MDRTGKPAFDFSLLAADGSIKTSKDYSGHWLLMMFHRHLG